jgi:hypothetical protein
MNLTKAIAELLPNVKTSNKPSWCWNESQRGKASEGDGHTITPCPTNAVALRLGEIGLHDLLERFLRLCDSIPLDILTVYADEIPVPGHGTQTHGVL